MSVLHRGTALDMPIVLLALSVVAALVFGLYTLRQRKAAAG